MRLPDSKGSLLSGLKYSFYSSMKSNECRCRAHVYIRMRIHGAERQRSLSFIAQRYLFLRILLGFTLAELLRKRISRTAVSVESSAPRPRELFEKSSTKNCYYCFTLWDSKGTVSLWRGLGRSPILNHRTAIPFTTAAPWRQSGYCASESRASSGRHRPEPA